MGQTPVFVEHLASLLKNYGASNVFFRFVIFLNSSSVICSVKSLAAVIPKNAKTIQVPITVLQNGTAQLCLLVYNCASNNTENRGFDFTFKIQQQKQTKTTEQTRKKHTNKNKNNCGNCGNSRFLSVCCYFYFCLFCFFCFFWGGFQSVCFYGEFVLSLRCFLMFSLKPFFLVPVGPGLINL